MVTPVNTESWLGFTIKRQGFSYRGAGETWLGGSLKNSTNDLMNEAHETFPYGLREYLPNKD